MSSLIVVKIDPSNKAGLYNSVVKRVGALPGDKKIFNLNMYDSKILLFVKWLLKKEPKRKTESFFDDGSYYETINIKKGILYHIGKRFLNFEFLCKGGVRLIYKKLGNTKINLVLTHWGMEPAQYGYCLSKKLQCKNINVFHGSDIHSVKRKTNHFFNCVRIIKNADMNIFVSKNLESQAKILFGNTFKSEVVYNGVDDYSDLAVSNVLSTFGIEHTDKVVGFVGNLYKVKNPNAVISVANSEALKNVKFIVVGDGPLKCDLEKNCPGNVIFLGRKSNREVLDILKAIDVLYLPSFNEGLPLVMLESLSSGTPVVASNVGGIPEVLPKANLIQHGNDFINDSITKIHNAIFSEVSTSLSPEFHWGCVLDKERKIIQEVLER